MPDDWLEEEEPLIPDPEATKPADWDESMDGEWEAPKIDNPNCKGRSGCGQWTKPMIDNPNYKVSCRYLDLSLIKITVNNGISMWSNFWVGSSDS